MGLKYWICFVEEYSIIYEIILAKHHTTLLSLQARIR